MGKGVGQILGIVAAIVIPFVAAPIAGAIGLSAAIGETAGATLVGAGLGAASSAATGGNPLLGAAMGGFGGYMANGGWDQLAGAGKSMFGGLFDGTPTEIAGNPMIGGDFSPPVTPTAGLTSTPSYDMANYQGIDSSFFNDVPTTQPPVNVANYQSIDPSFFNEAPANFDFAPSGNAGDQVAGLGNSYPSSYGTTMNDAGGYLPNTQVASATATPTTTVSSTPYGVDETGANIVDRFKNLQYGQTPSTATSSTANMPYANSGDSATVAKDLRNALNSPDNIKAEAALNNVSPKDAMSAYGSSGSGSKGIFGDMTTKDWLGLAGNAAKLGMTMFNKAPQQLTAAEQAAVQDAQRLAAENQALFAKRVEEARSMWSEGTPKPEQAFAQTGMTVERRLMDAQRGKSPSMQAAEARRASIEGTRLGTLAVSEDAARSRAARQTAMNALPTTAPTGAAGLALPIYAALDKRRADYARDLANATGGMFGGMFGGSSGRYA